MRSPDRASPVLCVHEVTGSSLGRVTRSPTATSHYFSQYPHVVARRLPLTWFTVSCSSLLIGTRFKAKVTETVKQLASLSQLYRCLCSSLLYFPPCNGISVKRRPYVSINPPDLTPFVPGTSTLRQAHEIVRLRVARLP